jgi:hypothetical protein
MDSLKWELAMDPTVAAAAAAAAEDLVDQDGLDDLGGLDHLDDLHDLGGPDHLGIVQHQGLLGKLAQLVLGQCCRVSYYNQLDLGEALGSGLAGAHGVLGRCSWFSVRLASAAMEGKRNHSHMKTECRSCLTIEYTCLAGHLR